MSWLESDVSVQVFFGDADFEVGIANEAVGTNTVSLTGPIELANPSCTHRVLLAVTFVPGELAAGEILHITGTIVAKAGA